MKTKCIIVDDEPLAIEVIQSHLSHFNTIEIVAKCRHALEAFEVIKTNPVDLMFLDIQMPHITGTDFLRSLTNPPKIILTTAYREYALEGFDLDVVDYLLKPIAFERFLKAMNKYFELVSLSPRSSGNTSYHLKDKENYIYVKADKKNHKIFLDDILFIESLKDYILIRTSLRKIITKIPISRFEQQLSKPNFIRIHRSYIVSVDKIEGVPSKLKLLSTLLIGFNFAEDFSFEGIIVVSLIVPSNLVCVLTGTLEELCSKPLLSRQSSLFSKV